MNFYTVINELEKKYPGKTIIKNDELNPGEIICEIEPTSKHPEYSRIIAVIEKSKAHYHKKATEVYKTIKGSLVLYINDKVVHLSENESYTIKPGITHWAYGNETWIECYSEPGWTATDHILSKIT